MYAFRARCFLCFKLKWFPLRVNEGYGVLSWDMFVSMVPAILSLGFGTEAGLTCDTRAELSEVLTSDYLLRSRTKGLSRAHR